MSAHELSDADERSLEAFDRAVDHYGLCPNRLWALAKYHPKGHRVFPILFGGHDDNLRGAFLPARDTARTYMRAHTMCSLDFCELSQINFTTVSQRHEHEDCSESPCDQITNSFVPKYLDDAATNGKPTAWHIAGRRLLNHSQKYMAISHVWSDGTGAGAWPAGHVNDCLYHFFADTAFKFDCDGIWWDTVCIPQSKAARAQAINNMHRNYEDAAVTLVHDCFLRDTHFVDCESACVAILMSPWFSRGWTALELASSANVYVLFGGAPDPVIKSLDELVERPQTDRHILAAEILVHLRQSKISDINHLLQILGPRHSSWGGDMVIIAGLLIGIDANLVPLDSMSQPSGTASAQEITDRILRKIKFVSRAQLFHGLPTVRYSSSWRPAQLLDLPLDLTGDKLEIDDQGNVFGEWRTIASDLFPRNAFRWDLVHPLVVMKVQRGFKRHDKTLYLLEDEKMVRRVLVVLQEETDTECQWCRSVGCLYLKQPQAIGPRRVSTRYLKIKNTDTNDHSADFSMAEQEPECCANKTQCQLLNSSSPEESQDRPQLLRGSFNKQIEDSEPASEEAVAESMVTSGRDGICSVPDTSLGKGSNAAPPDTVGVQSLSRDPRQRISAADTAREQTNSFIAAAKSGDLDTINAFLAHESMLFASDEYGRNALSWAAGNGHTKLVQALSSAGFKIEEPPRTTATSYRTTPVPRSDSLHVKNSSWRSRIQSRRSFFNSQDLEGRTPLSWAAGQGHVEAMTVLLRCIDVDMDRESAIGWSPLCYAVNNDDINVVQLLMNVGAVVNPNALSKADTSTDLNAEPNVFYAMSLQFNAGMSVIRTILEDSVRNQGSVRGEHFGHRALAAVQAGDCEMLRLLIEFGLDPGPEGHLPSEVKYTIFDKWADLLLIESGRLLTFLDAALLEGQLIAVRLMMDSSFFRKYKTYDSWPSELSRVTRIAVLSYLECDSSSARSVRLEICSLMLKEFETLEMPSETPWNSINKSLLCLAGHCGDAELTSLLMESHLVGRSVAGKHAAGLSDAVAAGDMAQVNFLLLFAGVNTLSSLGSELMYYDEMELPDHVGAKVHGVDGYLDQLKERKLRRRRGHGRVETDPKKPLWAPSTGHSNPAKAAAQEMMRNPWGSSVSRDSVDDAVESSSEQDQECSVDGDTPSKPIHIG